MTDVANDSTDAARMIDRWFPVSAVDDACKTPAGSGQNEKAIFTWFASRPIAQARAAVASAVLPDDPALEKILSEAIRGDRQAMNTLGEAVEDLDQPPVILDCFSGRGIIPLEAAKLGIRVAGSDLSPVAVLASRLLADWPLRDWTLEAALPASIRHGSAVERPIQAEAPTELFADTRAEPRLLADLRVLFAEIGRRVELATESHYPRCADGSFAWGTLWAVTIPCDKCRRRFPLLARLVLRHPYGLVGDPGQSMHLHTDAKAGTWWVKVNDGTPTEDGTMVAAPGTRGKAARCPYEGCGYVHTLATVKTKGFQGQYEDAPLVSADLSTVEVVDLKGRRRNVERKVFRPLTDAERAGANGVVLADVAPFESVSGVGTTLSAIPNEVVVPGNASTVDATGYGFMTFASLMNDRQALQFAETVRAIRSCYSDLIAGGISDDYAVALAAYASANLVRRLRRSTRGGPLQPMGKADGSEQNRNKVGDVFANQSGVSFGFDWFETGPGLGPGTWASLSETTLTPLRAHLATLTPRARPGKFQRASATALPFRDATIDAVVTDPPYYEMINYADVSDLFYVWLRRCLYDIVPDLFAEAGDELGLQDKSHEIIVKQGSSPGEHRTPAWYEEQLSVAFGEMRRVLKPTGTLVVVFGHSDPTAWRRLLDALRTAGFVVTSAWPARTESGETGVASIKVTVTIGCRVAPEGRKTATAAQVEREIRDLIVKRVKRWEHDGLALSDQLMASYGPSMEVVGRYRRILRPDGTEPPLDELLAIGRKAVEDAMAIKVDSLPLETFDSLTRFSIFWLRAFGRTVVNKGEARFHAQAAGLRIDELRHRILDETKGGIALTLAAPAHFVEGSSTIEAVRIMGAVYPTGGLDAVAAALAVWGRDPADTHLWATVAEVARQLPVADSVSKALTACQRQRSQLESRTRTAAEAVGPMPSLFDMTPGEG